MRKLFIVFFILIGCAPMNKEYLRQSFNASETYFNNTGEVWKDLHRVITLKEVKIHVVGDRKYFEWGKAAAYNSSIIGYAKGNEIWIFGRFQNGKIIVNQAVLGHEVNHLLQFADDKFANPDDLNK